MQQAAPEAASPSLLRPAQHAPFRALHVLGRRPCYRVSFLFAHCPATGFHSQFSEPRLPRLPRANGNLDIISIKELPDGSLHFSFGVPSETTKLSFSSGEYCASKLVSQRRPPSQFLRKSPIPVAVKRRKSQERISIKDASDSVSRSAILPSRPKSYFVKRSPIPKRTSSNRDNLSSDKQSDDDQCGEKDVLVQQSADESRKAKPKRLPSRFVKRSPIPAASIVTHGSLHNQEKKTGNYSVPMLGNAVGVRSRPKSKFVRKSPIVKVNHVADSTEVIFKETNAFQKPDLTKLQFHNASEEIVEGNLNAGVSINNVEGNLNAGVSINNGNGGNHGRSLDSSGHKDLDSCKVTELRSLAKMRGLKGYSKLKKAELLALLKGLQP